MAFLTIAPDFRLVDALGIERRCGTAAGIDVTYTFAAPRRALRGQPRRANVSVHVQQSSSMNPIQQSSPTDNSAGRWIQRGLILALMLGCAVALSKNQADPDFWGHVQYGRDAISDGLPPTTTYSYTADGHRWINHEVISEFLLAAGIDTIGPSGLLIMKCLIGLAVLGVMYRQAVRLGVSPIAVQMALLLVALNLIHFWSLRPQLISYTLFAVTIALLNWCFPSSGDGRIPWLPATVMENETRQLATRRWWLWSLPPLFALWASSHGGFLAGYCVLAAYLSGRSIQAVISRGWQAAPMIIAHCRQFCWPPDWPLC